MRFGNLFFLVILLIFLTAGCVTNSGIQKDQNAQGQQSIVSVKTADENSVKKVEPVLIASHTVDFGKDIKEVFSEVNDFGESVFVTGLFYTATPPYIEITKAGMGQSFLDSNAREVYREGEVFDIKKQNSSGYYTAKVIHVDENSDAVSIALYN